MTPPDSVLAARLVLFTGIGVAMAAAVMLITRQAADKRAMARRVYGWAAVATLLLGLLTAYFTGVDLATELSERKTLLGLCLSLSTAWGVLTVSEPRR